MNKSYVVWNNKGGVGKSTITFHVASAYAHQNPDRDIIVIDMCPQANVSMMLLGGGINSETKLAQFIGKSIPQTVVGYITDIITNSFKKLDDYIIELHKENQNLPENMYLLSGDGNLELIAPLLAERAQQPALSQNDNPWLKILLIIKDLTKNSIHQDRPCTFFIDTNPSFSVYTQMAILGGKNLLVPINADDSSIFAITGLFNLIWGSQTSHPVYGKYTFATKAKNNQATRPTIALLLGNRFTQKIGAANAFKALSQEAVSTMYKQYTIDPTRFISPKTTINNKTDFQKEFSIELRDFNSAGVVSANQGIPLSKMIENTYTVYGQDIQVSSDQRQKCTKAINDVVKKI